MVETWPKSPDGRAQGSEPKLMSAGLGLQRLHNVGLCRARGKAAEGLSRLDAVLAAWFHMTW